MRTSVALIGQVTVTLLHLPASLVNSMATVSDGKRLERFVRAHWGRRQGGIRALAEAAQTSPDTLYRWFNGKHPPDVEQLGRLAAALGVSRYVIVAAMDEAEPVAGGDELHRLIEAEVARQLRELGVFPPPRQTE
jgi:transcriptional regulator with XRE-family HTH domain